MNESIKLEISFTKTVNSDSEQYQEIDQEAISKETTFSAHLLTKNINEYDFFTQYEVKPKGKVKSKKKKGKNKNSLNLMDIINTELAITEPPMCENVITMVNYHREQNNLYNKNLKLQNLLKRSRLDIERGWNSTAQPIKLSPIFPKVLENTITKDVPVYTQYIEPVMFSDLVESFMPKEDFVNAQRFLDIEIQTMKFIHHHKFSLEILLITKLIEHYNEYLSVKNQLKEIRKNIKVSRSTKNNLKEQLLEITSGKKENIRFDATVLKYTEKLFYYKQIHMDMLKKEKDVIHEVFSLWSDIETVREKKGCTESNYFLVISKTTLSESDYRREWNNVFEIEYTDMLDKIEYEYANAYLEYKESKRNSKKDGYETNKIIRPKLVVDELKIKTEAEMIADQLLSKHKIELVLKHNKSMKDPLKPFHVLCVFDYYFKFFIDDVFVCESETYRCKDLMNALEISETFSIQILPKNKTLNIVLYENEIELSTMNVNIEEIKHNITMAEVKPYNFENNDYVVYPNNKYVGSGYGIKEIAAENKVRLRSSNIFKASLMTTCKVNIMIGWSEKFCENSHETVVTSFEIGQQIKRFLQGINKPNVNDLIDIIKNIYNRNVENEEKILTVLRKVCKTEIRNDYTFIKEDDSCNDIRLKLLHLRNNGGFLNIEDKLVPLFASEISTEQLSCHQNDNNKFLDMQNFDDEKDLDPIDLQRYIGVKYVEKLNENVRKTWNEFLLQKTHKDVVKDFKDLSWRGLLTNRSNLMKLSTSSFETRQQLLGECAASEQEIQVTVLRAFNLPDRMTDSLSEHDEATETIAGFKVKPLRPYVKLSYRGVSAQTAPGIGCYPSWNQAIKIRTRFDPLSSIQLNVYDECKVNEAELGAGASGGRTIRYRCLSRWLGTLLVPLATVLTLGTLRGTFKLTSPPLIIGYESPTPRETSSLIPEVRRMLQKDVSFLTLNITTSLSHLGGAQAYSQPVPNASDDVIIEHLNAFVTDYSTEFPTRSVSLAFVDSSGRNRCVTEFLQPIPTPGPECYPIKPKSGSGSAVSRSSALSRSSSSKSSGRRDYEASVTLDGEHTYGPFDATHWRHQEDQRSRAVNMCIRYVSLIPTYEHAEQQVVTLTGLELLKIQYGTAVDHSILLASFLLHLGIKCFVATGMALPRGLTSFVLVAYDTVAFRYITIDEETYDRRRFARRGADSVWQVFEASAGERYELRDVTCPLKTISHVFDEDNIWVNIQSSLDCESVCFDFSKSSDWRPVFHKLKPLPRQPILSMASIYGAPCAVEALQEALETKIKTKVQKWRARVKTVWNRYCGTLLGETLPQWEYWAFNSTEPRPEPGPKLKQLMVTYKMFGFPLNMPYTNAKNVLATVKACALHASDDAKVEFALAVRAFAYPSAVISVWVYLVSITRV